MADLDDLRRKVKEIKDSIYPTVRETFEEHEAEIIHIQTEQQLYEGKDSKGFSIRPAYRPFTVRIKKKKGQPFDRVTWKDSGKLYRTMKLNTRKDEVEITPTVEYAQELIEKYGSDVLGIQEEFLKDFLNKFVVPNIIKETNDIIAKP